MPNKHDIYKAKNSNFIMDSIFNDQQARYHVKAIITLQFCFYSNQKMTKIIQNMLNKHKKNSNGQYFSMIIKAGSIMKK